MSSGEFNFPSKRCSRGEWKLHEDELPQVKFINHWVKSWTFCLVFAASKNVRTNQQLKTGLSSREESEILYVWLIYIFSQA